MNSLRSRGRAVSVEFVSYDARKGIRQERRRKFVDIFIDIFSINIH